MDIDHLWFAPPQAFQVAGQIQRVADGRAAIEATATDGGEPLDFSGPEVEQIHDGARDSQQVAQARKDGLGDLHRGFRRNEGPVDLVQHREPLGGPGQRGGGSPLIAQREPAEPGEPHGQDHANGP